MTVVDRWERGVVAVACAFETLAITTGRVPTICRLCAGRPLRILAVAGWLVVHMLRYQPVAVVAR